MREYAALGMTREIRPPVSDYDRRQPSRQYGNSQNKDMKHCVDARLAAWAETAICVRMHKLKKVIDSVPPGVLRRARLERQMREWLACEAQLERQAAGR